ncbi:MAG: RAQPRD family integrative conjugative element protein [Candidatus Thiodiazotropha sp. (ex Lucinoma borealis)]|nr:RAQPRD family integrative conjugative element protein [Candidatus Thiodiazotropha sp. (ex Lucinoma borealis)]MCU7865417.1 RAQPRD family integrative conjugative element protein [Candidatus Thiodiazotropha sp. (ex Lucinoma borealis)]
MRRQRFWMSCAVLLLSSGGAQADAYSEKEALQRLSWEVHAMEQLLQEAERNADPSARFPFRYDKLRKDLLTVRHGIEMYISTPMDEPRQIEPLLGDYRH